MRPTPIAYECPFFSWERYNGDVMKVGCEGAMITFRGKPERNAYIKRFCADVQGYKDCPVAKMLEKKYEEEDA